MQIFSCDRIKLGTMLWGLVLAVCLSYTSIEELTLSIERITTCLRANSVQYPFILFLFLFLIFYSTCIYVYRILVLLYLPRRFTCEPVPTTGNHAWLNCLSARMRSTKASLTSIVTIYLLNNLLIIYFTKVNKTPRIKFWSSKM